MLLEVTALATMCHNLAFTYSSHTFNALPENESFCQAISAGEGKRDR